MSVSSHTQRRMTSAAVVFLAIAASGMVQHCCLGQDRFGDASPRYLAGLRARRLFSLAEQYCLRRLADPALPPDAQVWYTIELSQCFIEHATYRTGQEQTELWNRAAAVVAERLAAGPPVGSDRLRLQAAYVPAARAAFLCWQFELAPYDDSLRQQAIAQSQAARDALRQIESTLSGADADTSNRKNTSSGAPASRHLLAESGYRMAAVSLDLARLLPTGIERTSAIHDAEVRLEQAARGSLDAEQRLAARLLLATAARLRNDGDRALDLLDALSAPDLPLAVRQQAAAEQMRVALDRGAPDAALNRLKEAELALGVLSEELRCVGVEARLAARSQALEQQDLARAATHLEAAQRDAARIGGPWGARSAALLDLANGAGEYGAELAPLILSARAALGHGDAAVAIARYGDAAGQAEASGRHGLAAELRFTRASLLLQSEQYLDATADFLAVASGEAPPGRAAEAHLLAAYCRGKLWEAKPTQSNREAYTAALQEHRARYVDQPTRIEADWMLAALFEARLQWTEALELYEAIPVDHARSPAARIQVALLYERILNRLRATEQPREEWEARAVERLLEFIDHMPAPPAALAAGDAEVVLSFARIVLALSHPDYDDSDALLRRVIDSARLRRRQAEVAGDSGDDPEWLRLEQTAEQLLIVSLAGQDRITEAHQALGALTAADPEAALAVLDGLSDIATAAQPERRATLGDLQLKAAEEVQKRRAELSPAGEQRLDDCLAQALVAAGRPLDAVRAYRRLLERAPQDRELLARAARGIAELGAPDAVREAKSLWRRLETLEARGSTAWLAARLEVARCCQQLGELDECRKLLAVTRVLYPDLGGPDLKPQFDQLEAAVKSAP